MFRWQRKDDYRNGGGNQVLGTSEAGARGNGAREYIIRDAIRLNSMGDGVTGPAQHSKNVSSMGMQTSMGYCVNEQPKVEMGSDSEEMVPKLPEMRRNCSTCPPLHRSRESGGATADNRLSGTMVGGGRYRGHADSLLGILRSGERIYLDGGDMQRVERTIPTDGGGSG